MIVVDNQVMWVPIDTDFDIVDASSKAATEYYKKFKKFPNRICLQKSIGETSFNVLATQTEQFSAKSVVINLVVEVNSKQQSRMIGVYLDTPLRYC